jgi:hypothetical protein
MPRMYPAPVSQAIRSSNPMVGVYDGQRPMAVPAPQVAWAPSAERLWG